MGQVCFHYWMQIIGLIIKGMLFSEEVDKQFLLSGNLDLLAFIVVSLLSIMLALLLCQTLDTLVQIGSSGHQG